MERPGVLCPWGSKGSDTTGQLNNKKEVLTKQQFTHRTASSGKYENINVLIPLFLHWIISQCTPVQPEARGQ